MVASLKELKKPMSCSPPGPSFRRAKPKAMANTTRPRMFILSTSPSTGTFGQEQMETAGDAQSMRTVTEGLSWAALGPSHSGPSLPPRACCPSPEEIHLWPGITQRGQS